MEQPRSCSSSMTSWSLLIVGVRVPLLIRPESGGEGVPPPLLNEPSQHHEEYSQPVISPLFIH